MDFFRISWTLSLKYTEMTCCELETLNRVENVKLTSHVRLHNRCSEAVSVSTLHKS